MPEDKKHKVILVDDDDFLVDMYAVKFGNAGLAIEMYKSGASFLGKIKDGCDASLIFLDIVMPGMDGIEILREMRKNKLAEGVPVVMLTNQNDEKDVSQCNALGVSGYIIKSSATPTEVVEEALKMIKNARSS